MNPSKPDAEKTTPPQNSPKTEQDVRANRKYAISSNKGKAKGKIRYIETNDPSKGCRFL